MKDKNFEELMQELEVIVRELESENLSLEKSIEKYQRGIELSKLCHEKLKNAQKVLVNKIED
ncbi:exodeoxyribonuclease VII small subunit [Mycoplasmatota bacterium WC44]